MSFPVELGSLLLYAVQQLGVMLGIGAQTILLIAYLISIRDTVIDKKETEFAIAITRVLRMGLLLIILSGAGAAALHVMLAQIETILTPAFLFKWILIAFAVGLTFGQGNAPYPRYLGVGLAGANWYALFTLHILAPITTWVDLGVLYAVWITGFILLWSIIVFAFRKREKSIIPAVEKPVEKVVPAPIKITPPPPPPKIVAPPPSAPKIPAPVQAPPVLPPKPVIVSKPPPPPLLVPVKPQAAEKMTEPTPIPNIVVPQKPVVVTKPAPVPMKQLPHFSLTEAPLQRPKNTLTLSSIGKLNPGIELPKENHPLPSVPLDHTLSAAPHKPVIPTVAVPQKPAAPVPQKPPMKPLSEQPITEAEEYFELPAIRVMPRTPEEIGNQNRPGVVQFN